MSVFRSVARAKRAVAPLCLHVSIAVFALVLVSLQPAGSVSAGEPVNQAPSFAETTGQPAATRQSFVGNVRNRARPAEVPADAPVAPQADTTLPEPARAALLSTVQDAWVGGYRDGGGHEDWLPLAMCIIGQESTWNPSALNVSGPYYGLGQFLMSTWNSAGGGDWRDPYTQGLNFARNWNKSKPSTQWPRAYLLCSGAQAY